MSPCGCSAGNWGLPPLRGSSQFMCSALAQPASLEPAGMRSSIMGQLSRAHETERISPVARIPCHNAEQVFE